MNLMNDGIKKIPGSSSAQVNLGTLFGKTEQCSASVQQLAEGIDTTFVKSEALQFCSLILPTDDFWDGTNSCTNYPSINL